MREGSAGASDREPNGSPAGREDDSVARARAVCLRLLASAPRTRAQLEQTLQRRGIGDAVVESVLGRFSEAGLIDDTAFAHAWVDSRHAGRGLGRSALAVELRRRGVDEETVHEAVDELSPEREEATARALVRRKLGATRGAPAETRLRRAMGTLARKGYSASLAYRLVREELEAEGVRVDVPEPDVD